MKFLNYGIGKRFGLLERSISDWLQKQAPKYVGKRNPSSFSEVLGCLERSKGTPSKHPLWSESEKIVSVPRRMNPTLRYVCDNCGHSGFLAMEEESEAENASDGR